MAPQWWNHHFNKIKESMLFSTLMKSSSVEWCACVYLCMYMSEGCLCGRDIGTIERGLMFAFSESSSAACECAVVKVKAAMVGVGLVSGCFLQDHSAGCITQQSELSALSGAVGPHKPAHTQPLTQQTQRAAHTPILSGDHLHQVQYNTKQGQPA